MSRFWDLDHFEGILAERGLEWFKLILGKKISQRRIPFKCLDCWYINVHYRVDSSMDNKEIKWMARKQRKLYLYVMGVLYARKQRKPYLYVMGVFYFGGRGKNFWGFKGWIRWCRECMKQKIDHAWVSCSSLRSWDSELWYWRIYIKWAGWSCQFPGNWQKLMIVINKSRSFSVWFLRSLSQMSNSWEKTEMKEQRNA